ncbi:hypothetical protein F2Q68_00017935 [Brassica cretica]|uniref:Uncharacterized protein n=1 Tax=Brassica cretica TaxID=69181 RepID=A0A8S9HMS9_BRACR|nr:hypothetical protein F2Q68_00017935 [Brassica cretica]
MMMNLNFPNYIKVAELGCSSGQNAFLAISEIINTISVLCQQSNQNPPEIDCCLNDLPENDFNATFKSIPFFNKELMITNQASCFVYGAPGSFYSRLFSRNSLHFIHSSYALHWLSNVPEKLVNDKENVYITNASSQSAYKAYLNQFNRDYTMFLKLRSEEIVSNGRMVLTFIGRNTLNNDPLFRDCCHFWTLLSKSLHDLVFETTSRKSSRRLPGGRLDFQEVFQTTSRRSSGLPGSLPDDFQKVVWTSWKSSDGVFSHVSPFHNRSERFDLEDFWDDLPVSRLKYNALDDFQEVFQTTSRKSSRRLPEVFQTTSRKSFRRLPGSLFPYQVEFKLVFVEE